MHALYILSADIGGDFQRVQRIRTTSLAKNAQCMHAKGQTLRKSELYTLSGDTWVGVVKAVLLANAVTPAIVVIYVDSHGSER